MCLNQADHVFKPRLLLTTTITAIVTTTSTSAALFTYQQGPKIPFQRFEIIAMLDFWGVQKMALFDIKTHKIPKRTIDFKSLFGARKFHHSKIFKNCSN